MSAQDEADLSSQDGDDARDPTPGEAAPGETERSNSFSARTTQFWKRYVTPGRVIIVAIFTGATGVVANIDNLSKTVLPIYKQYQYTNNLRKPYPAVIPQKAIDRMSTGEATAALMRIDGYLGRLKDDHTWKKLCVLEATRKLENTETPANFLNLEYQLNESSVDQQNRDALEARIRAVELSKAEDEDIQRKPNAFERLLTRASKQLLVRYQHEEIDQLDKPQLYLLRNAIYGQHGYVFATPKLHKYTNRMGWKATATTSELSVVEVCNVFFLDELYPTRELGPIGRGILLSSDGMPPAAMQAQICACLGQPSHGVECREDDGSGLGVQFYSYVDFVMSLRKGDRAEIRWTYLDPSDVADAGLPGFLRGAGRFRAVALQFSASLHQALAAAGEGIETSADELSASYWGVTISLPDPLVLKLRSNPKFALDVANVLCAAAFNIIEQTGPILPMTVGTAPEVIEGSSLQIFSKPIVLDDQRRMLTREYVARAYPASNANIGLRPRAIVLHSSRSEDMDSVFRTMLPAAKPGTKPVELNPATHYLVGVHGKVYRLLNDTVVARHAPGLDLSAIGITLVGAGPGPASPQQVAATAALIERLKQVYPDVGYVVSSEMVRQLADTDLWAGPPKPLEPVRPGPGEPTMAALSPAIGQLGLRSTR